MATSDTKLTMGELAQVDYDSQIKLAIQQRETKVRQYMSYFRVNGKRRRFQVMFPLDTKPVKDAYDKTDAERPEFRERWLKCSPFKAAHKMARREMALVGTTESPLPRIVQSQKAAMNRRTDLEIVKGLIGPAWEGENGDIRIDYDEENQVIPVGYVYSGAYAASGLTADKITHLVAMAEDTQILGQNVDPQELGGPEIVILMTAKEKEHLLHDEKVINGDYGDMKPLGGSGNIYDFMGCRLVILPSKLLPIGKQKLGSASSPTAGADVTDVRTCIAFVRGAVAFGDDQDVFARVSELPDDQYVWQAYLEASMGAARIEDQGVWKVYCKE